MMGMAVQEVALAILEVPPPMVVVLLQWSSPSTSTSTATELYRDSVFKGSFNKEDPRKAKKDIPRIRTL